MNASDTVQAAVQQYLDERRRLGFNLAGGQLMRFARFADARNHSGPLTLDLQLDWAREHVLRTSPTTWARRLEVIRPFAAYYRQFEPESAVPDPHTFGRGHRRLAPHIYTDQEIIDLIEATGQLAPTGGLRPATFQALFGLIASTGLRLSEALHLKVTDIDLRDGVLVVRQTKFNKSRRLPMHPSAVQALRRYEVVRDCAMARAPDMSFFVSLAGHELSSRTVHNVFERLRDRLGWVARGGHPRPRIHDLRHNSETRIIPSATSNDVALPEMTSWTGRKRCSELSEALQEIHNAVAGLVARYRNVLGSRCGERALLQLHVCVQINGCGLRRFVPEPECDHGLFGAVVKQLNAWLGERCRILWGEIRHPEYKQFSVAEMAGAGAASIEAHARAL